MNNNDRKSLHVELRTRVAAGMEARLALEDIQHQPRTQRLLNDLYPPDDLVEKKHRDILRGFVQDIVNEKGERVYVYVEQMQIAFDPETETEDDLPTSTVERSFVPLSDLDESPSLRRAALLRLKRLVCGSIRRAGGYIAPEQKSQLLTSIGEAFDRMVSGL